MNDGVATPPGAWGQVRVQEPAGERVLGETLSIGGSGSDIVVPGVQSAAALSITRRAGLWVVEAAPGAVVRFNGRPFSGTRDLRREDVLSVGDAQLSVSGASRTLLRLSVAHLAGNVTIAPAAALATLAAAEDADQDLEIEAPRSLLVPAAPAARGAAPARVKRGAWLAAAAALIAAAALTAAQLGSLALEVHPRDARIRTPGALSLQLGGRLWMLPGEHRVLAERDGYLPAQAVLRVRPRGSGALQLRLVRLPGKLQIDTAGVVAAVSIDGVPAGLAPGLVNVPAGERTISLRAPRYVDYATPLRIEGAGVRQELHVRLQPSWGSLAVTAIPQGAHVSVDGIDSGAAPVTIAAESGVRRIRITASGSKPWESSVVLSGGQSLALGPVTLGQPDAHLAVRSSPAGAEVTVAGIHRGRAPLALELPAGIAYPIVVSLPGYATWTQSVFAATGSQLTAEAHLMPLWAQVTVTGEPSDAELLIDGALRGQTPQSLTLSAVEHRVEVRKAGFVPFEGVLTPVPDLPRTLQYHLTPSDRARALAESAPLIRSQLGQLLRLVPPGTFPMGSERREPGSRPNEGLRSVTLARPFYIGVMPVTNGEFRRFRAAHASGYIARRSLDLDDQPVTAVSWEDAAEFCNWLSQQEGLPAVYERRDNGFVLRRPVTRGYRLPTEAEWEYAARYAAGGEVQRFAWGNAPPVPEQAGNLAGSETADSLPAQLPGYRDDYPVLAPVGRFRPNALGLHDMSGNVSQWVNDYYQSYLNATPLTDPLGPAEGTLHAVRGANWKTATVSELRLAWRDAGQGTADTLGFRIARYADDPQ
jgi:formylglycine-generating enzyme required for sulfatase activity